jgi:hypothetical protein
MALDDGGELSRFGSGFVAVGELSSWHLKMNRGLFFPLTPLWRTAVARGCGALAALGLQLSLVMINCS